MNKLLVFVCLFLLGFICWRDKETLMRWKDQVASRISGLIEPPPEVPVEEPAQAPPVPPVPANPIIPPAKPTPPPLPPPPEGVYFLKERVSVTTDAGVRSHAAGTRVTKTGENLGLMVVTDGKTSFAVESGKLTRDMALVEAIRRKAPDAAAKAPGGRIPPPQEAAPSSGNSGSQPR